MIVQRHPYCPAVGDPGHICWPAPVHVDDERVFVAEAPQEPFPGRSVVYRGHSHVHAQREAS